MMMGKGAGVLCFLIVLFLQSDLSEIQQNILTDETLIVPGVGSEKVLIGSKSGEVNRTFQNYELTIVRNKKTKEVFTDILKSRCSARLTFDTIYHYKSRNVIIFFLENRVKAIAGLRKDRVTIDAADLRKGIGYFVFTYGNDSLEKIYKGKHIIYVYPSEGIAVTDDGGNGEIDMYLIFSPQKNKLEVSNHEYPQ